MYRLRNPRRMQIEIPGDSPEENGDGEEAAEAVDGEGRVAAAAGGLFMGMKVPRRASLHKDCKGDYIGVASDPYLTKILSRQGDRKVLFADKVLKFTGSGKMKRRVLVITDFALFLVDPDADVLKRRIALAAVDKLCLSKLSDNFLAVIVPTEYDLLLASTRKTEIVNVLLAATRSTSEYELEVVASNSIEYNAAADMVKEVQFEEVEGGIKTTIRKKLSQ